MDELLLSLELFKSVVISVVQMGGCCHLLCQASLVHCGALSHQACGGLTVLLGPVRGAATVCCLELPREI